MRVPRWSIVSLAAVLMVVGLFLQGDNRSVSATSFGEAPWGFAALVELFEQLGHPVSRNLAPPSSLPASTLWMIEPAHLCRSASALASDNATAEATIGEWVDGGGTLVVFLASVSVSGRSCGEIAGVAIPTMAPLDCKSVRDGDRCRIETAAMLKQKNTFRLEGAANHRRRLRLDSLRRFQAVEGWSVAVTVDGAPFVVERPIGAGRVVLVADSRFLRNQWLDQGDAAVVAVELARTYGTPTIDEWSHGYRLRASLIGYLARSSALAVLFGFAFTGAILAWYGALLPARRLTGAGIGPSLQESVDTLAAAYAATVDFPHLQQRYREYTGARLRHHLGLPTETSTELLCEQLRSRGLLDDERARLLLDGAPPRSQRELIEMAVKLDQLILEVIR